jgi:hypothetical protein
MLAKFPTDRLSAEFLLQLPSIPFAERPGASGQNSRSAPPFSKGRVSAAAKRRRGRIRFDDCFCIHTNIARLRQLESGDRADKTGLFRNPKVRARKENRLAAA